MEFVIQGPISKVLDLEESDCPRRFYVSFSVCTPNPNAYALRRFHISKHPANGPTRCSSLSKDSLTHERTLLYDEVELTEPVLASVLREAGPRSDCRREEVVAVSNCCFVY